MDITATLPASVACFGWREEEELSPHRQLPAGDKRFRACAFTPSSPFLTCVCLCHAVSGNYTGESVDNAATIRLAAVSSMFSFQGCHTEKTMQRTCWLRRELPLFYHQSGVRIKAAACHSWYSTTICRSLNGLLMKVLAEVSLERQLEIKVWSWLDIKLNIFTSQ